MMQKLIIITVLLILISSGMNGQAYSEINKAGLLSLLEAKNDTTYVVNFWATWCSPCVKEIQYFEELHMKDMDIMAKVILVSLDFPNMAGKRLVPFLKEKGITATVLLMTDVNYNDWIDSVDPTWSGAIPATLIFNRNERIFLEQELTREELFEHVKQISN